MRTGTNCLNWTRLWRTGGYIPATVSMAHLIGVGEVTEDMLNQPHLSSAARDVVGVSGVERQYNTALMGKNGARRALVNSHGREVGLLEETDAVPGKPLKLSVDIDLQIAAEEALEGKNGAIVAMDPRTGEDHDGQLAEFLDPWGSWCECRAINGANW